MVIEAHPGEQEAVDDLEAGDSGHMVIGAHPGEQEAVDELEHMGMSPSPLFAMAGAYSPSWSSSGSDLEPPLEDPPAAVSPLAGEEAQD